MIKPVTLNLIGGGKVGQTIGRLLQDSGRYAVQDVLNRTLQKAAEARAFIGAQRAVGEISEMRPADLWLITVPDGMIASIAGDLARACPTPSVALHCSGFFPAAEMRPLGEAGWQLASAHPVTSFADPAVSVARFAGTLVGVEGDAVAVAAARALFEAINARCFAVRSDAKAIYHGAAVIANNLTTVLQALALECWAEAGVSDEVVHELHAALLRSTVENVLTLGPQAGLTGPAARGDMRVVTEQQAILARWHPQAGEVYRSLSEMAARLKRTGQTG